MRSGLDPYYRHGGEDFPGLVSVGRGPDYVATLLSLHSKRIFHNDLVHTAIMKCAKWCSWTDIIVPSRFLTRQKFLMHMVHVVGRSGVVLGSPPKLTFQRLWVRYELHDD